MVKKIEVLAIVPARGGSKSIPFKNIKLLNGVPLLAYSIAAALQSKLVNRVIVSTDSEKIAETSREWGAETPFMRPSEHAQDDSIDHPLFVHALEWFLENENYKPDIIIQLRPTTPIRPIGMVDSAIGVLLSHPDADSVRGVVPAGQNPHKMWRVTDPNSPMKNLLDVDGVEEPYNALRQTLPPVHWQTGHIDVIRPHVIQSGLMSGKKIYPFIIDPIFTVDIDNEKDWKRTEWLMKDLKGQIVLPKKPKNK
jgi:CMP-N-acetylneuraminic acid synthetase